MKVGQVVTTKEPVLAYYSGYAKHPICVFEPGMQGKIAALDVPGVITVNGKTRMHILVDFMHMDLMWRVALTKKQVRSL